MMERVQVEGNHGDSFYFRVTTFSAGFCIIAPNIMVDRIGLVNTIRHGPHDACAFLFGIYDNMGNHKALKFRAAGKLRHLQTLGQVSVTWYNAVPMSVFVKSGVIVSLRTQCCGVDARG
jgi:hypothetical protein